MATSGLKTAIPVLAAWTPVVGVMAMVRQPSDVRKLVTVIVAATGVMILLSLAQLATGGFEHQWIPVDYVMLPGRLHGISSPDANGTARQMLPAIVCLAGVGIVAPRLRNRWWLLGVVLCGVAVLLTASRTALASATVGVLVIGGCEVRRRRTLQLLAVGTVLAGATAIGLLASGIAGAERLSLDNLQGRFDLYPFVWQVVAQHPLMGTHVGGYSAALAGVGYRHFISPHNMWLGVAVEWGLPMACWLSVVLVATWWMVWTGLRKLRGVPRNVTGRDETRLLLVLAAALAAVWSVHGLTEIVAPEWVFLTLGLAAAGRYRLLPQLSGAHRQGMPPEAVSG